MSSSNDPLWPLSLQLARSSAGVPWSPSKAVIQLFGHPLKIKELIDQISCWANYDFPTIQTPPPHWIECKATLAKLHETFLFSNYLMTKIAFSILYSGHSYRHHKADLELFWAIANEQYKELTYLLKKSEQDTYETLHLRQPSARDKPIPLHQSEIAGFEMMPTFLEILTRNNLFTGLVARVKGLINDVQTILRDEGDYTMPPPEMNIAEFLEVLTQIANSSSSNTAARRSGHAQRETLAIHNISNASQQPTETVAGMSTGGLGDIIAGPTEEQMRRMRNYSGEVDSEPEMEPRSRTADKPSPAIQKVKSSKPVVVTPSERRLRRRQSHRAVIVDENEIADEKDEDRTEK